MKLTQINRAETKMLTPVALAAIQAALEPYGLAVAYKSGRYTGTSVALTFEASVIENGQALDRTAREFQLYASQYGLKAEDLGRKFEYRGRWFQVTGLKTGTKLPLLAVEMTTGRGYKFGPEVIGGRREQRFPIGKLTEVTNILGGENGEGRDD